MKRFFVAITVAIILVVTSLILLNHNYTNPNKELIKMVIKIAVESGEIPDYNLIEDKKNIIISSKNIERKLLPELSDIKFTILTPNEIKDKANKEGDFLYLEFKEIDIKKINASISIDNKWAVADNSKGAYLSGGGMIIAFHKLFGKWIEDKTRQMWIS